MQNFSTQFSGSLGQISFGLVLQNAKRLHFEKCTKCPNQTVKEIFSDGTVKDGYPGGLCNICYAKGHKKLDVYSDPAHGWVKGPKLLIQALGLEIRISKYWSMKGDSIFLEEDCDASLLLEQLEARNRS